MCFPRLGVTGATQKSRHGPGPTTAQDSHQTIPDPQMEPPEGGVTHTHGEGPNTDMKTRHAVLLFMLIDKLRL